jgi:Cof subfamily protein (haloacid dehalogenase superfamily)
MPPRAYDAILLDLDGTLVADDGTIHPVTRERLHAAAEAGVIVMIATGRSEATAVPAIEALGIDTPAVIYNCAEVYCPRERRLLEERNLSHDLLEDLLEYADRFRHLPVVMCAETKLALTPRTEAESIALHDMRNLHIVEPSALRVERPIRVSLFSAKHRHVDDFVRELAQEVGDIDAYLTWFPLSLLPSHRTSDLCVIDVQPPCLGKAEAFRVLQERYGVPAARTIAIGDAENDLPMIRGAGLGVAMGNSGPEIQAAAHRVIGTSDTPAIGELVEELLLGSG